MRRSFYRTTAFSASVCFAIAAGAQEPGWSDVTTSTLAVTGSNARGASWIDFDSDGDLDIYVIAVGQNHLFRNDDGVFVDVTVAPLDNDGQGSKATWGDMDNDGDPDLFISNGSTPPPGSTADHCVILRNDGEAEPGVPLFVDVTPNFVANYVGLMRGAAWCDYNNDGFLDFYLALMNGSDQSSRLVKNVDGSTFVDDTSDPISNIGVGRGIGWRDYDNDGDQDLYVVNGAPGGTILTHWLNRLFRNDGDGVWTDVIASEPFAGHGRGVAWGDFDNDGDFDLYIANVRPAPDTGRNRLLRNDGNDTFVDIATGGMQEDERTRGCGFVDYDNDGDLDLYVGYSSKDNKLFRNNGDGTWSNVARGTPLADPKQARGGAWADYDDDGDMDLYIIAQEANTLVRNDLTDTSSNHWLEVHLIGTVSNRDSVGARIRVVAGPLAQIREIHREHGYFAEDMLTAHFGMGPHTVADRVNIRWPSGARRVLYDVPTNQKITLTEPTCSLDWNGDGTLSTSDFLVFLNAHAGGDPIADLNFDGNFDTADFIEYLNEFVVLFGAC